MILKLKWKIINRHYNLSIFSGPDKDHLSACGVLVFYKDEAVSIRNCLYHVYDSRIAINGTKLISELYEEGWE